MSNEITSVNKYILLWARKYYSLSEEEVANKTGIPIEKIIAWENGSGFPTYPSLKKLSIFYKKPLIVFFMDKVPSDSAYEIACRSNPNISKEDIGKKITEMFDLANIFKMNLEEFYCDSDKKSFIKLLEDDKVEIDSLNEWLRENLVLSLQKQKGFKTAAELLEYIRKSLYEIGIYVFKDSFKTNSVSGLCLFDENFPIILLNNKMSFTRQLFTVFHEIYHLYNKKADLETLNSNEEQECDKFASEFLLPSNDFIQRIKNIENLEDEYEISDLANEYKVSRDAICYRLQKINKISPQFYTAVRKSYDEDVRVSMSKSSGGSFYTTKMNYLGKTYLNNIVSAYYAGKITIQQVGKYTNLKTSQVSSLASTMTGGKL